MARQTFTQLQNTCKDYISQSSGSVGASTVANFIKQHINQRYHLIQRKLQNYIVTDLPQTCVTVADQQRYHYPPNIYPPILSATWEVGGIKYSLDIVDSQIQWNEINMIEFEGSTVPQYLFPIRDHFELWPIPQTAGETITLVCSMLDRDMTIEDYTTGTVTITNNSASVVGDATTWTAGMVGRWFQGNADQHWYRIASFTDTTHITLESVFEGSTVAGDTYTIGEVPEIPPELCELIPHGVAADFYAGPRKDFNSAQSHNNYFWTGDYVNSSRDPRASAGGLINALRAYSHRGSGKIIHKDLGSIDYTELYDDRWTTTLSSTI
jgi:hypothetical protein